MKLRAYLELIRVPNVFTAVADILAGFLYVGGVVEGWSVCLRLALASACLYSGGIALNDVCDAERDARERPDRPIPSGRLARGEVGIISAALLLLGVALAATVSARAAVISILLVATIVLYDVVLKATPVAPPVMGLCRALNLILGMSAAPMLWTNTTLFPAALMWLYITSVTLFAHSETRTGGRRRLGFGTAGVCVAVGGLVGLLWILPKARPEYLLLVGVLLGLLGYRGYRAAASAQPMPVQRAVKTFVLSLILFDTCIAAAARGPVTALTVAVMLLPGLALGRLFRVT